MSSVWITILAISTCIFAFSYLKIGLSYPGFTRPNPLLINARICDICKVPKLANSYHCSSCNVCIEGHDHHCPWIGKCVGRRNLSAFYFFLVMIFGNLILCFVGTISTSQGRNLKIDEGTNKKYVIAGWLFGLLMLCYFFMRSLWNFIHFIQ